MRPTARTSSSTASSRRSSGSSSRRAARRLRPPRSLEPERDRGGRVLRSGARDALPDSPPLVGWGLSTLGSPVGLVDILFRVLYHARSIYLLGSWCAHVSRDATHHAARGCVSRGHVRLYLRASSALRHAVFTLSALCGVPHCGCTFLYKKYRLKAKVSPPLPLSITNHRVELKLTGRE